MRRCRNFAGGFPCASVIVGIIDKRTTAVGTVSARDNALTITNKDRWLIHNARFVIYNRDGTSAIQSTFGAHGIYLIIYAEQTDVFSAYGRALISVSQLIWQIYLLPSKSVVAARQVKRLVLFWVSTVIIMPYFSVAHARQADESIGRSNACNAGSRQTIQIILGSGRQLQ